MGYMGLDRWGDSDNAADFRSKILDAIANECEKEIKDGANCYNTPGWVNIALVVAEDLLKDSDEIYSEGRLYKALSMAKKRLQKSIKEATTSNWDDEANRKWHVSAWKRMIKSIDKVLDRAY